MAENTQEEESRLQRERRKNKGKREGHSPDTTNQPETEETGKYDIQDERRVKSPTTKHK